MQLFIIIILLICLIFALIGITTNYWYQNLSTEVNEGLWLICHRETSSINNKICLKRPYNNAQGLAVSGVILLIFSIIFSTIRRYKKSNRLLSFLTILILIISTILLIFSYLLHPKEINLKELGYSIYFMLISSVLCLITIGLVAFTLRTNETII